MPRTDKVRVPLRPKEEHQPFRANALVGAIERTTVKSTMHGCRGLSLEIGALTKRSTISAAKCLEFACHHRIGDEAELSYWDS